LAETGHLFDVDVVVVVSERWGLWLLLDEDFVAAGLVVVHPGGWLLDVQGQGLKQSRCSDDGDFDDDAQVRNQVGGCGGAG